MLTVDYTSREEREEETTSTPLSEEERNELYDSYMRKILSNFMYFEE